MASSTTEAKRAIIRGMNSSWVKSALDLIEESYGLTFNESGTTVHEMDINFTTSGAMASMGYSYSPTTGRATGKLTFNINISSSYFGDINVSDENGALTSRTYTLFDTTLAHEFTHAVMEANIDYFSELPGYIKEGAADLVPGADGRYVDIHYLLTSGKSALQNVFSSSSSSSYNYAGGFMILRYMAKQGASYSGKTQQKVIKDFMYYLDVNGGRALDGAINYATGGRFSTESQMISAFMSAVNNSSVTTNDQADTFIKQLADIDLGGWESTARSDGYIHWNFGDSGSITGRDAGGSIYKTEEDVVPTLTNQWTLPRTSTYTYKGLTINWPGEFVDPSGTYDITISTSSSVSGGNNSVSGGGNDSVSGGGETSATLPAGLSVSGTTLRVDSTFSGEEVALLDLDGGENIIAIDASANSNSLMIFGNALNNSIKGGSGQNFISGLSGQNTLTGGSSRDQFWYTSGERDIVTNFSAGSASNSDVIVLHSGTLSSISRTGETVSLNMTGGGYINLQTGSSSDDDIILYSTDGENISGAKIAASSSDSLTYSSSAKYFKLSQRGQLIVNGSANNNIWLNGSRGQYFSNVANIDASAATGRNTLAGNTSSNIIFAGSGSSSLWGGSGNVSDTLVGGSGTDTFWFGKNDGADVINNASSIDTVRLYNVSGSDISSASILGNIITARFGTGASLTVNCTDNLSSTFRLANGSSWQYNRSSRRWQRA